jgi:hypothetical protein
MLLLWTVTAAWPCGDVPRARDARRVPAQEGSSGRDGWSEVDYRVEYEGDAADFGWVHSDSGAFVSLKEADPKLFDNRTALFAAQRPLRR